MFAFLLAAPLLISLGGGPPWNELCAERGWRHAPYPASGPPSWTDAGAKAVAALAASSEADPARIYLAGAHGAAAGVFYCVSRLPGLFAAALAVEGDPRAAIESNRLFTANSQATPLVWLSPRTDARLAAAGFRFEVRPVPPPGGLGAAFDWLAAQQRDPFPQEIDCESGNPAFARCSWAAMTKFNTALRNDALTSTRVPPGSGATLALGPFDFNREGAGPGVAVVLPADGYKGPLKPGDRIVSAGGKPIANPAAYAALLDETFEAKPVAVVVERAGSRIRLETRFILPAREENLTARIQARYLVDLKQIEILTRFVSELRFLVPDHWAGATVTWNGAEPGVAAAAGCWVLSGIQAPALSRCPND
jgi:hypothetical protein